MPGLSFLSKKSWHTSNVKNVEKVWIAEQEKDEEAKKLRELQKQLEDERQIKELRQLQAASGQTVKTIDNSLDWMYTGPASQSEQVKQAEDYLLGKIFKPKQLENQTTTIDDTQSLLNKSNSSSSSSNWVAKVNTKNDTFTRIHEDPMLVIKKKEKEVKYIQTNFIISLHYFNISILMILGERQCCQ